MPFSNSLDTTLRWTALIYKSLFLANLGNSVRKDIISYMDFFECRDELSALCSLNGGWTSLWLSDICHKVRSCSLEGTKLFGKLAANAWSSVNLYKAMSGERVFGEWDKDIVMGFCM